MVGVCPKSYAPEHLLRRWYSPCTASFVLAVLAVLIAAALGTDLLLACPEGAKALDRGPRPTSSNAPYGPIRMDRIT